MIFIQCAKTPFLWDLNQPGCSGESDRQNKNSEGVEASKPRRQIEEAEIVKDSARSGVQWAGRRSRNQIGQLEDQQNKNTSWKWKSFPKSKNTKWSYYDITEALKHTIRISHLTITYLYDGHIPIQNKGQNESKSKTSKNLKIHTLNM